jgi:hypothetical protein
MYPLAAFVRELRQDWPLHAIQTTLADLGHLPYEQVAVAAVRAAVDPAVPDARGIRKLAGTADGKRRTPGPPPVCRECRRPHDPARPGEHVAPPPADTALRGAERARRAITDARKAAE